MKHLSILITAILISFSGIAQDCKFELGLQAGPNLTTMRYASSVMQSNIQPHIAGMAGLFVQYNISTMFALRIDPAFERLSNNSGEVTFSDPSGNILGTGKLHFRYDYISIPVLARASIGNKVKYFLNVGPSIGFLCNQSTIADWPEKTKTDNTAYFETLNIGVTGGIGVALPIKEKFSLSFEIRDNFGFSNINVSTNTNNAIKTNATSLLVGFAYKLGKKTTATFTPTF